MLLYRAPPRGSSCTIVRNSNGVGVLTATRCEGRGISVAPEEHALRSAHRNGREAWDGHGEHQGDVGGGPQDWVPSVHGRPVAENRTATRAAMPTTLGCLAQSAACNEGVETTGSRPFHTLVLDRSAPGNERCRTACSGISLMAAASGSCGLHPAAMPAPVPGMRFGDRPASIRHPP
jgi:hypothetical protein